MTDDDPTACPVCDEAVTSLSRDTITDALLPGADLLNPDAPSSPFVGHIVTGRQIRALPCGDLLTEAQAQALERRARDPSRWPSPLPLGSAGKMWVGPSGPDGQRPTIRHAQAVSALRKDEGQAAVKMPPPIPGRNWLPGVPAAGHVSRSGYWHPGDITRCAKCNPEAR